MNCTECKKDLASETLKRCPHCGAPVAGATPPKAPSAAAAGDAKEAPRAKCASCKGDIADAATPCNACGWNPTIGKRRCTTCDRFLVFSAPGFGLALLTFLGAAGAGAAGTLAIGIPVGLGAGLLVGVPLAAIGRGRVSTSCEGCGRGVPDVRLTERERAELEAESAGALIRGALALLLGLAVTAIVGVSPLVGLRRKVDTPTQAVEALLRGARARDGVATKKAHDELVARGTAPVQGLVSILKDPSRDVRLAALAVLQDLGPAASSAAVEVHALAADRSEDSNVRQAAVGVLGQIGALAAGSLISLVGPDQDPIVRGPAACALAKVEAPGAIPAALPVLVDELGAATPEARSAAAAALVRIGDAAVAALQDAATNNDDPRVREGAAQVLKTLGK